MMYALIGRVVVYAAVLALAAFGAGFLWTAARLLWEGGPVIAGFG